MQICNNKAALSGQVNDEKSFCQQPRPTSIGSLSEMPPEIIQKVTDFVMDDRPRQLDAFSQTSTQMRDHANQQICGLVPLYAQTTNNRLSEWTAQFMSLDPQFRYCLRQSEELVPPPNIFVAINQNVTELYKETARFQNMVVRGDVEDMLSSLPAVTKLAAKVGLELPDEASLSKKCYSNFLVRALSEMRDAKCPSGEGFERNLKQVKSHSKYLNISAPETAELEQKCYAELYHKEFKKFHHFVSQKQMGAAKPFLANAKKYGEKAGICLPTWALRKYESGASLVGVWGPSRRRFKPSPSDK